MNSLFKDDLDAVERLTRRLDKRFPDLNENNVEQWVQHLVDLGFIDEQCVDGAIEPSTSGGFSHRLLDAIKHYRAEQPEWVDEGIARGDALAPGEYDSNIARIDAKPGVLELDRLARFTSFDGELSITPSDLPKTGQRDLISRSIHYRLRILGLSDVEIDTPWSDASERGLKRLARLFSPETGPLLGFSQCLAMIFDVNQMAQRYISFYGEIPVVALTRQDANTTEDYISIVIVGNRFVKEQQLHLIPGLDADQRATIMEESLNRSEPDARFFHPANQLGLTLLQLCLWTHGFYRGRLDGVWSEHSVESLRQALEFEQVDTVDALLAVQDGYIAINMPFLLGLLTTEAEDGRDAQMKVMDMAKQDEAIFNEVEYLVSHGEDQVEVRREEKKKRGVLSRIWSGVKGAFRRVVNLGKRIYYGARTLLRSAVNAVMKGVRWVTGELSKLFAPVINMVRTTLMRIKQGIALFHESLPRLLRFVLRQPIKTAGNGADNFAVSRFDLDADVVVYAGRNAKPQLVLHHATLCRALARGSTILIMIGVSVAKLLIKALSGPVGWLRLGFDIGRTVYFLIRGGIPFIPRTGLNHATPHRIPAVSLSGTHLVA